VLLVRDDRRPVAERGLELRARDGPDLAVVGLDRDKLIGRDPVLPRRERLGDLILGDLDRLTLLVVDLHRRPS